MHQHAASSTMPWLQTSGNTIVAADTKRPVVLCGANVLASEWDNTMEWDKKAISTLAQWGGNIIVRGFASMPVNGDDQRYLSMLDEHVSLAEINRMYVVFAWRSNEINGEQPPRPNATAQQALVALATRYKGKPNVVYALQVEPHDVDWTSLRPQFETMVDAIRAASSPRVPLIMIPGTDWSGNISSAVNDPVKRPSIVYKVHTYEPNGTYQSTFGVAFDAGLPVFVGEFGPSADQRATMRDMHVFFQFTRDRGIGWAAWYLNHDIPEAGEALMNADGSPSNPWGRAMKNELGRRLQVRAANTGGPPQK